MKVLKFGGTSVGTAESLAQVKNIVEAIDQPAVVVVSALGGVTDRLEALARTAAEGDKAYETVYSELAERHHKLVKAVVCAERQTDTLAQVDALLDELRSILHGVCLIQDLTPKTANAIVAYGERLSSVIVTAMLTEAQHVDARSLVKTVPQNDKHLVDFGTTNSLLTAHFSRLQGLAVMGGFIAADLQTGVTTNLGRGGSDYTAAIVAAALGAECLEIWTDVDGFLTADPRIIPTAYTIDHLTYAEAMELCNFGAKVVYPPTIYPVCQ